MNPQPNQPTPVDPPVETPQSTWETQQEPTADLSPEPDTAPFRDLQPTQPDQTPAVPVIASKKSSSKLILIIVGIIVLLAIGVFVGFIFLRQPTKTAETVVPVQAVDSTKTNNANIDAATGALVDSATAETTLVATDDSANASDASKDATKVEESIDENSF